MKLIRSTAVCKFALLFAGVSAFGAFGNNDPYIQSDGANTVNLGYFASKKTKIEVDFQFAELVKTYDTVFGHYGNDLTFLLYAPLDDSLAGTFKFSAKDGGYNGLELSPRVSIDLARHKAVIDMPNRHVAMYAADGSLQGEADLPSSWTADNTSDWPLILFGSSVDARGSARYGRCAKAVPQRGERWTLRQRDHNLLWRPWEFGQSRRRRRGHHDNPRGRVHRVACGQ